jgi:hypothetical protein
MKTPFKNSTKNKTIAALLIAGAAVSVTQSSSFASTTSLSEQISSLVSAMDPRTALSNAETYKKWSIEFSAIARDSKMGAKEKRSRLLGYTNVASKRLKEYSNLMTAEQLKERSDRLAKVVKAIDAKNFEAAARAGDDVQAEFAKAGI